VADLAEAVTKIVDPQGRGRQFLATRIAGLDQTRAAGFVLTRQESVGKWSPATYALQKIESGSDGMGHRGHRDHQGDPATGRDPMTPMPPMPYGVRASGNGADSGDGQPSAPQDGRACRQCNLDDGQTAAHDIGGGKIWLHRECVRFYRGGQ